MARPLALNCRDQPPEDSQPDRLGRVRGFHRHSCQRGGGREMWLDVKITAARLTVSLLAAMPSARRNWANADHTVEPIALQPGYIKALCQWSSSNMDGLPFAPNLLHLPHYPDGPAPGAKGGPLLLCRLLLGVQHCLGALVMPLAHGNNGKELPRAAHGMPGMPVKTWLRSPSTHPLVRHPAVGRATCHPEAPPCPGFPALPRRQVPGPADVTRVSVG